MKTIRRLALPLVLLVLLCAALCCTACAEDFDGAKYYNIQFTTHYPAQWQFYASANGGWDENAIHEFTEDFYYEGGFENRRDKSFLFTFLTGRDGYIHGSMEASPTVTNLLTGENVPVTGWTVRISLRTEHPHFNPLVTGMWEESGTGDVIYATKVFSDLPKNGATVVPFSAVEPGVIPSHLTGATTFLFDLRLTLADGNSCRLYLVNPNDRNVTASWFCRKDCYPHPSAEPPYYAGTVLATALSITPKLYDFHFAIEKTVTGAPEGFQKDVPFEYSLDGGKTWFPTSIHVNGSGKFTKEIAYQAHEPLDVLVREITAVSGSGSNVTITGSTATYAAYQIITGDFYDEDEDGVGVLTDMHWGNGITDAGKTALAGGTDAGALAAFAAKVADYNDDQVRALAEQIVNSGYLTDTFAVSKNSSFSGLAQGWYLIKTVSTSDSVSDAWSWTPSNTTATCGSIALATEVGSAQTARFENVYKAESTTTPTGVTQFMLQVIGEDVDIEAKVPTIPESEKKVWENSTGTWEDEADAQMGVNVPFRLTAKLPTTYEKFHFYHLVMEDILPAGMDYTGITKVYYTNDEGATTTAMAEDEYTVTYADHVLKIDFSKLKENENLTDSTWLVVEYTAVLNKDAVVNAPGNMNTLVLRYTNDPNYKGEGEEPTGTTTPDDAVVYTYALALHKVDENKDLLSGAVFDLKTESGVTIFVAKPEGADYYMAAASGAETFTTDGTVLYIKGLDAGTYTLTELKAPDGYNLAQPVTVILNKDSSAALEDGAAMAVYPVTILDEHGTVLPSTGGPGTAVYTIVGITLMLTAACLLERRRKMA